MKFKLTASIFDHKDIDVVAKELETNLGSPIISISKFGTFTTGMVAKKWRLNYRYKKFVGIRYGTFWELTVHKRYTNDPWFTNFLLRWA